MRKTRVRVMTAVACALLGTALTSGSATASTPAPMGVHTTASKLTGHGPTLEAVTLRAEPTTRSAALGVVPKGSKVLIYEGAVHGMYRACGKRGNLWLHVQPRVGAMGWVARTCVKTNAWPS
ncbi:SH3 domain-containing protein [Streptomyces lydicus]